MHDIPMQGPRARRAVMAAAILLGGCEPDYPPPPRTSTFWGLPVTGDLPHARRLGFDRCLHDATSSLRCVRSGVRLAGYGPFEAAVDLKGGDGRGGFDRLTIWYQGDQYELQRVGEALKRNGWKVCFSGQDWRGDQAIYTKAGARARVTIDLSYYMKRRLRLFREDDPNKPVC